MLLNLVSIALDLRLEHSGMVSVTLGTCAVCSGTSQEGGPKKTHHDDENKLKIQL